MSRTVDFRYDEYGRECARCHEYKSWGEYHNRARGFMDHVSLCKSCVHEKYSYDYNSYKAKHIADIMKGETTKSEPIEIKKEYKPRYELPNIDEVIGFKCIEKEEEFYY